MRCRLTASSYAARRLRSFPFIVWEEGLPGTTAFSAASRVSISELLGGQFPGGSNDCGFRNQLPPNRSFASSAHSLRGAGGQ